jgi:hypothetical protein
MHLRSLTFTEPQRICLTINQSSDWSVGYAAGVLGTVSYLNGMSEIPDSDDDHDN